jgi:elongation factor G
VGHGAVGKTTLVESLLAATGAITSRGAVEKGNTVCDFDPVEKQLGHSLQSALVSLNTPDDSLIHLIDTPGYPDFAGQAIGALAAWTPPWWSSVRKPASNSPPNACSTWLASVACAA